MSATTKTHYETDFAAWADEMAAALRARAVDELDWENIAEEIEGLVERIEGLCGLSCND